MMQSYTIQILMNAHWEPQTVMKMPIVRTLREVLSACVLQVLVEMEETAIMMVCLHTARYFILTYKITVSESDIDECDDDSHDCQQLCINTIGSYECACEPGYFLKFDGKGCLGTRAHNCIIGHYYNFQYLYTCHYYRC